MGRMKESFDRTHIGWKCYWVGALLMSVGFGIECDSLGLFLIVMGICGIIAGIVSVLSEMD